MIKIVLVKNPNNAKELEKLLNTGNYDVSSVAPTQAFVMVMLRKVK